MLTVELLPCILFGFPFKCNPIFRIKSQNWAFHNRICDPDPTKFGSEYGIITRIQIKCLFGVNLGVFQSSKVEIMTGLMLSIRISLIPLYKGGFRFKVDAETCRTDYTLLHSVQQSYYLMFGYDIGTE